MINRQRSSVSVGLSETQHVYMPGLVIAWHLRLYQHFGASLKQSSALLVEIPEMERIFEIKNCSNRKPGRPTKPREGVGVRVGAVLRCPSPEAGWSMHAQNQAGT